MYMFCYIDVVLCLCFVMPTTKLAITVPGRVGNEYLRSLEDVVTHPLRPSPLSHLARCGCGPWASRCLRPVGKRLCGSATMHVQHAWSPPPCRH